MCAQRLWCARLGAGVGPRVLQRRRISTEGPAKPEGAGPLRRLGSVVRSSLTALRYEGGSEGTSDSNGSVSDEDGSTASPLLNWDGEELPISQGLGFGFSAGGLLFPYFVGNAVALKRLGLVNEETVYAGSSAGSLISACLVCDLELEHLMGNLLEVSAPR